MELQKVYYKPPQVAILNIASSRCHCEHGEAISGMNLGMASSLARARNHKLRIVEPQGVMNLIKCIPSSCHTIRAGL